MFSNNLNPGETAEYFTASRLPIVTRILRRTEAASRGGEKLLCALAVITPAGNWQLVEAGRFEKTSATQNYTFYDVDEVPTPGPKDYSTALKQYFRAGPPVVKLAAQKVESHMAALRKQHQTQVHKQYAARQRQQKLEAKTNFLTKISANDLKDWTEAYNQFYLTEHKYLLAVRHPEKHGPQLAPLTMITLDVAGTHEMLELGTFVKIGYRPTEQSPGVAWHRNHGHWIWQPRGLTRPAPAQRQLAALVTRVLTENFEKVTEIKNLPAAVAIGRTKVLNNKTQGANYEKI